MLWLTLIWLFSGIVFYRTAKKHHMNRLVWTAIGLFSYVLALFLGGVLLAFIYPDILLEKNAVRLGEYSIYIGFIGILLTWIWLKYKIRLKTHKTERSEIIDDITTP